MVGIDIIQRAKNEAGFIERIDKKTSKAVLLDLADRIVKSADRLIAANELDFEKFPISEFHLERLLLTKERISDISKNLQLMSELDSPVGEVMEERMLINGLNLKKIRIPFGVIGMIYEANPEIALEAFALCLKSGNTIILCGDSKAEFSNQVVVSLIKKSLIENGISPDIVQVIPFQKENIDELINATELVDLIISRGLKENMDYVRQNSKIPIIENGRGVVHIYFDKDGDLNIGKKVLLNSKTRRVTFSNTVECLIIHQDRLKDLPDLVMPLSDRAVEIEADNESYSVIKESYPNELLFEIKENSFGTEFLDYKLSIKTVKTLEEAIIHIKDYGTNFCESIISTNEKTVQEFFNKVDSAVIFSNTSTAFNNGEEFGVGVDIGISTHKLNARGPISMKTLTNYKWLVKSDGAIKQ